MKTSEDGKQKTEEGYLGESRVEPEDNQGVRKLSTTFLESQVSIQKKTCHLRNRRILVGVRGVVKERSLNYPITLLHLDKYILINTSFSCEF